MIMLLSNVGFFRGVVGWVNSDNNSPAIVAYDELRKKGGVRATIAAEHLTNEYLRNKLDSVVSLVRNGHVYTIRDYFIDYRDVQDYAALNSPWNNCPLGLCEIQNQVRVSGSEPNREEVDRAREEILGMKEPKSTPINWSRVTDWLLRQYLMGLLPALLMCLILARQGRISFSFRKSPVSALAYLALWPINLGACIIAAFQDIDREARLRTEKDSLFSKLSGLEEEFLNGLRDRSGREELLSARRAHHSYIFAIIAVLVMRVVPVVAQNVSETEHKTTIEMAYHDPPDSWSSEVGDSEDPMCIFAFERFIAEAKRRFVWWPSSAFDILVGFNRDVHHVPLSDTV